MRQLHDKLQQLLQNASFITKCINAVAKGEVGSAKMPLIYYYRKENESLQSIGLPLCTNFSQNANTKTPVAVQLHSCQFLDL